MHSLFCSSTHFVKKNYQFDAALGVPSVMLMWELMVEKIMWEYFGKGNADDKVVFEMELIKELSVWGMAGVVLMERLSGFV